MRKLVGWLIVGALSVALMVAASFWSFQQIEDAAAARQRNDTLLAQVYEVKAALVDAETGERGFLLTGDEAFLDPWLEARQRVQVGLAALGQGTVMTRRSLSVVSLLIDQKFEWFARNIALKRTGELSEALDQVRGPEGKPLMDRIRSELGGLIKTIELDRDEREVEFQRSMRLLYGFLIFSGCRPRSTA